MAQPQQFGVEAPVREAIDREGKLFFTSVAWIRFWNYLMGKFWVSAPALATSTGTAGQMAYDAGFLYICIAPNSWKRVAIAAW